VVHPPTLEEARTNACGTSGKLSDVL